MRITSTVLVLALLSFPVAAQERPAAVEPFADRVVAAHRDGDRPALEKLAAENDPDPWSVAEALLVRGERSAALAFAGAAPRKETEKLAGYVGRREITAKGPGAWRDLLAAEAAVEKKQHETALRLLGRLGDLGDDVLSIRAGYARGMALRSKGRLAESCTVLLDAVERALRIGWWAGAAQALRKCGGNHYMAREYARAKELWRRELEIRESLGDRRQLAATVTNLGNMHFMLLELEPARRLQERAVEIYEALAYKPGLAFTLLNLGGVVAEQGDYEAALPILSRALTLQEELNDLRSKSQTLRNFGVVFAGLGDYAEALSHYRRSLALCRRVGFKDGQARDLEDIAGLEFRAGNFTAALAAYEEALDLQLGIGDRVGMALTLGGIANTRSALGDAAGALRAHEESLALCRALKLRSGLARALLNLGTVYAAVGNPTRALTLYREALDRFDDLDDPARIAMTLTNIAGLLWETGDLDGALQNLQRAIEIYEGLRDEEGLAQTLGNLGRVHLNGGDPEKALDSQHRALEIRRRLELRASVATTLVGIAQTWLNLGDHAKALAAAREALAEAEVLCAVPEQVAALGAIAAAELMRKRPGPAQAAARKAVKLMPGLVTGLGEQQGASVRERRWWIFEAGVAASVALGDPEGMLFFLEKGRAGELLEALNVREALQSAVLPKALREAEIEARSRETALVHRYRRALERGDRKQAKKARAELDKARSELEAVIARIQREAKAEAGLVHPEVLGLEAIRATLADGEALVLYHLQADLAAALVVTGKGARIADLGSPEAVETESRKLVFGLAGGSRGLELDAPPADRDGDPSRVAAVLAGLLVKPLGLGPKDRRLLVSPHGVLGYVPFSMLAGDREVVHVPSGTIHALMAAGTPGRGEGVLALGGPENLAAASSPIVRTLRSGEKLGPLPGARKEAEAVGSRVLVGKDATETLFRKALGEAPRWRSVHLACHGLVNIDRPMFSSLALGADDRDDGFLTVLDVFRMRIPADLVVLSACETAKGKLYRAEGIVGLARAFFFAGASRVICSLWKVDDEATRVLMEKFYELWNPADGKVALSASAALRKAQEHVRSRKRWEHPRYWAAWVLWGRGD